VVAEASALNALAEMALRCSRTCRCCSRGGVFELAAFTGGQVAHVKREVVLAVAGQAGRQAVGDLHAGERAAAGVLTVSVVGIGSEISTSAGPVLVNWMLALKTRMSWQATGV